jgi:hypothetical protein
MRQDDPPHLNDGARVRTPRPESGEGAHCPFEADRRRLDGIALARHGQKRDDALAGKRSMRLSPTLQDRALLQYDLLRCGTSNAKSFAGSEAKSRLRLPAPERSSSILGLSGRPRANLPPNGALTTAHPPTVLVSRSPPHCLCGIRPKVDGQQYDQSRRNMSPAETDATAHNLATIAASVADVRRRSSSLVIAPHRRSSLLIALGRA